MFGRTIQITPIRGIFVCCARTARRHAPATLNSAMNVRISSNHLAGGGDPAQGDGPLRDARVVDDVDGHNRGELAGFSPRAEISLRKHKTMQKNAAFGPRRTDRRSSVVDRPERLNGGRSPACGADGVKHGEAVVVPIAAP